MSNLKRIFDSTIEAERLVKEGATLKNVSDNFRTLMILGALLAISLLFFKKMPYSMWLVPIILLTWFSLFTFFALYQSLLLSLIFWFNLIENNIENNTTQKLEYKIKSLKDIAAFFSIFLLFGLIFMLKDITDNFKQA